MLGDIQTTALPNGCRIVTSAMPGVDSFSLCFDAGTGGRFERPAEGGFSHFLEHMLFKGSRKRPSTKALSTPLERVGGQFNAYTAAEHTCFHAVVPADAAALAADVLGDMFAHPLFDGLRDGARRGALRGALEEQVLEEVAEAEFGGALAAAAGPGVDAHGKTLDSGHRGSGDAAAVRQDGDVRGSQHGVGFYQKDAAAANARAAARAGLHARGGVW